MNIITKLFGEVEVDVKKVIHFENGIIGFEDCKEFMLIHDAEKAGGKISWLQSIDEPALALPVIDPLLLLPDYNPVVEDELLKSIGELKEEDLLVLVTLTVPQDLTKMTANLRAPMVINASTVKGCQVIVENTQYLVKYPIYDLLQSRKGGE